MATKEEIEALITQLSSDDYSTRRSAAKALGETGDARAVGPLIGILSDDDWEVRDAVARSLGKLKDRRAVTPLMRLIANETGSGQQAAVEALGEIGDARAAEALIAAFTHTDTNERFAEMPDDVLIAIHKIGAPAGPALIKAIRGGNEEIRYYSTIALFSMEEPPVPALMEALKDKDPEVRYCVDEVFKSMEEAGKPGLPEGLPPSGERITTEERIGVLVKKLGSSNHDVYGDAMGSLVEIGSPAVPALIRALADGKAQENAIQCLSRIGDKSATPVLLGLLEKHIQTSATVEALGALGDDSAVPALLRFLMQGKKGYRDQVLESLLKLGSVPELTRALLRTVELKDYEVQQGIIKILGELGDSQAVPALLEVLKQDLYTAVGGGGYHIYVPIHRDATVSLTKIGSVAVPALIDALDTMGYNVTCCVASALGEIGDSRAAPALIESMKKLGKSIRSWGDLNPPHVDALAKIGDVDLLAVQDAFREVVAGSADREKAERIAAEQYIKIADAVSKRRQSIGMEGLMLSAEIKAPKGPKMFREKVTV